ncbi:AsmA family protein [Marilutibacter alkalisoli]|uniref:AsmA family protein n=1 Tax=Marilutibacter alkalisoli TaxID=2591633 RepID=A0A514BTT8_9GAMM|nr:AsmA family protein [Lysobacter alkalisoli]QDH70449.1 AsmA family protein [Lysobacter alkalisoli]
MTPQELASSHAFAAVARHPWWSAAAVLAAAIVVLVLAWDWNWFKGPVERIVQARTQRSFEIGGDLDVKPGRVTLVRADALQLGNAAWSEHPGMASAERLELRLQTLPLLIGRVRAPEIRLTKPRLLLEANPEGGGNWDFATGGDGDPIRLRRLWIDDGRLRFLDASHKTDIDLAVSSSKPPPGTSVAPIGIAGGGHWKGAAFELEGHAQSPLALQDDDPSYRIDLQARAGDTRAHARGELVDPLRLQGFDLRLKLSGQDLEDLYPLIGIALPPTPPYTLDGRFSRDDDTWHYDGFSGTVGDSDLAGSASVTVGGTRPYLRADLVSKRLDFDDLAGFVGGTPRLDADGSGDGGGRPEPDRRNSGNRVLPDTPYELDKLRAMDAQVRLRALRINAPRLPLDGMDARLKLEAGVLQLQPLDFGVAGGHVRADIHMDARQDTIRTRVDGEVRSLDLGKLFPDVRLTQDAIGKIGGSLKISGTGNSVAQILGSADGDVAIGMGRGQISNLLLEYAGLDIAEALRFLLTGDRKVPIRCAFGDFAVKDGIMDARTLAFDTTDTLIVGKGNINLREETFDLELRPRPKDRSILALRSPLVLEGTFRDPDFHPDMGRLGVRGAIALTLGSIAPPAALLAMLELGGGQDHDCGGQYAK